MKNSSRFVLLLGFLSFGVLSANAQFTGVYTFSDHISQFPSATNVQFQQLAWSVSPSYVPAEENISSTGWAAGGSSPNVNQTLTFRLSAFSGLHLNLSSFSFDASSSSTGPTTVSVELFVQGVSQRLSSSFSPVSTASATTSAMTTHVFDFTDLDSIASTSLAEFRIYAWGGSDSGGELRLDNVSITGSVSAIPEPGTYATIAGGIVLGLSVWRRRRHAAG